MVTGAEAGAKQFRQIQDRLFRPFRVGGNQTGNGIHAVEQEVGLNAGLKRCQMRLHFRFTLLLPLVLQVKITQHHEHDQQCQQHFFGHSLPHGHAILRVQYAVGKKAEGQHIQQNNDNNGGCRPRDGHPRKPCAQEADQGSTGEGGPLHEQRQQPEVIPVNPAPLRLHYGEHQNQQFTGDQQQKHGPHPAQVRNEELARSHVFVPVTGCLLYPGQNGILPPRSMYPVPAR